MFVDKDIEFEIKEKEQEIDIQAIEEFNGVDIGNKLNELILAVKQLNRKLEEK